MSADWAHDSGDPNYLATADRIVAALRKRNGPLWEKELRQLAEADSIGAYFRYLSLNYGVVKIVDIWNRPDDDNKMYALASMVQCVDRNGQETALSELYTNRP